MNKRNWISVVGVLFLGTLVLLAGCSGEEKEATEEAGVVEQASDKVAGKAMEYINKPLDKAKQSQAAQNAQTQNMEDMLGEGDTETEN
ncbi:Lipoprotein [Candidatus Electrothrix laxa]